MTTTQHPALKRAPKSAKEAGRRLIAAYKNSKLQARGKCHYTDKNTGKPCAIGHFFTKAQRQWILEQKDIFSRSFMNNLDVGSLANEVGRDNIEAMTGMSLEMCMDIQAAFDGFDGDQPKDVDFVKEVKRITRC